MKNSNNVVVYYLFLESFEMRSLPDRSLGVLFGGQYDVRT